MDKEKNSSQDIKNAMAFIPILAFIFYFIDTDKTERFTRNLKYAMILFAVYIIFSLFLRFFMYGFVVLIYFGFSIFLWYMAYIWKDVHIEFLDKILESFDTKEK